MDGQVFNAIFAVLTGAIGWLAKQYIDTIKSSLSGCKERESALQKIIDDRALEAMSLSEKRAEENTALREEIAALKVRAGIVT